MPQQLFLNFEEWRPKQWPEVVIKCPSCGLRQLAEVIDPGGNPQYEHTCIKCDHYIDESEWLVISK